MLLLDRGGGKSPGEKMEVEVGNGKGRGGVDFRATGRLRKAIMSARGCLGCKLLSTRDSCEGKGTEKGGVGRKGCRRKCPLSWLMFDAAPLLPTPGRTSGNTASEEAMRGSC